MVSKKQLELFLKRFGPPEKSLIKVLPTIGPNHVTIHLRSHFYNNVGSRFASKRESVSYLPCCFNPVLIFSLSSWFHGKQSRVASERLLAESKQEGRPQSPSVRSSSLHYLLIFTSSPTGNFLLRYSSLEGAFTVDYIKQGKICHFNNIKNDPQGGVCVFVG